MKDPSKSKAVRVLKFFSVVVCLFGICTLFIAWLGQSYFGYHIFDQLPFEQKKWWQTKLYGADATRYRMHQDLVRRYKLIGMTRGEVGELLGPQSDPNYFKDWDLRYWLGPEPGFIRIDSIWLVIRLKDGKVFEYKLVTD